MRISSRGQYGVRAMAHLASRYGGGPVQVREIARVEQLSPKYLEQLLGRLRLGGLVRSVRGARGGYALARSPEAIKVREILVLLEGSLAPVGCLEGDTACSPESACRAHHLWSGLHDTVMRFLDSYTLADVAAQARPESTPEPEPEPAGAR